MSQRSNATGDSTSDTSYEAQARRHQRRVFVASGLYVVLCVGGTALLVANYGPDGPPRWLAWTLAAICIPPIAFVFQQTLGFANRHDGIERSVFLRSTSTSFIVLMSLLAIHGILEAFVRIPTASAWWFYGLGGLLWVVLQMAFSRSQRVAA